MDWCQFHSFWTQIQISNRFFFLERYDFRPNSPYSCHSTWIYDEFDTFRMNFMKKFKFQFLRETKTKTNVNRNRNATFIFLSTKPRKLSFHHATALSAPRRPASLRLAWLSRAGMGSQWSLCSFFIDFSAWADYADGPMAIWAEKISYLIFLCFSLQIEDAPNMLSENKYVHT